MKPSKNTIDILTQKLMDFDPLDAADQEFGRDSEKANKVGLALMMEKSSMLKGLLKSQEDSYYGISFKDFINIATELGFHEIYSDSFIHKEYPEEVKLFWDNRGILLRIESYHSLELNSAKIYYNWQAFKPHQYGALGSYHMEKNCPDDKPLYIGDTDVREGFVLKMSSFLQQGEFLPQWVERPFLYLVSRKTQDQKTFNFEDDNEEIISKFPESIQKALSQNTMFKRR